MESLQQMVLTYIVYVACPEILCSNPDVTQREISEPLDFIILIQRRIILNNRLFLQNSDDSKQYQH